MALSTAHAIIALKMPTSGFFSTCAQESSMLTFANLNRVPISTSTTGTVKCWDFSPSWGFSAECSPMQDFKNGSLFTIGAAVINPFEGAANVLDLESANKNKNE